MIRQVSVFVENKPGSLMDVTSRLTEAGVNIRAVATFDTPEFGILRMVVDKPDEAKEYLTKLAILAKGELNINYIYSFIIRDGKEPVMVFNTDDFAKAEKVLKEAEVKIVEEADL